MKHDELVLIKKSRLESLLFYSFRYTLGRSTYAVSDVARALVEHSDVLENPTKELIIIEIERSLKGGTVGMDIDKAHWVWIKELFEKERPE